MSSLGVRWYLAGGIAIDLLANPNLNLSRRHTDIDIQIDANNLRKLQNGLIQQDIPTHHRLFSGRILPGTNFIAFERCHPDLFLKDSKIILLAGSHLLPRIDVFCAYPAPDQGYRLQHGRGVVVRDYPLSSDIFVTGKDFPRVELLNPEYLLALKKLGRDPKSLHDLQLLTAYLKESSFKSSSL